MMVKLHIVACVGALLVGGLARADEDPHSNQQPGPTIASEGTPAQSQPAPAPAPAPAAAPAPAPASPAPLVVAGRVDAPQPASTQPPPDPFAQLRIVTPIDKLPPQSFVRIRTPREAEDRSREGKISVSIGTAPKGAFVVLCSDVVPDALELVLKLKEQDEQVPFSPEDIPNRTKELVVENTNVEETTHDL